MQRLETPKDIPIEFSLDRKEIRNEFDEITAGKLSVLSEEKSKKIFYSPWIPL